MLYFPFPSQVKVNMYYTLRGGLRKTQMINGLRTFTVSDGMRSSIKYKSLQVFFYPFQRKQQTLEKQNCFPFPITGLPLHEASSSASASGAQHHGACKTLHVPRPPAAAPSSGQTVTKTSWEKKSLLNGNGVSNVAIAEV